ncbi:hypothetical protein AVEN_125101-1 [Araneus ventricosus]|uniref:Uncharacterized protein n=1 Tax=Araneus ventricosus TaxID=182803 RepID=A0A4Y2M115_ARAVE|nr:hypothetical protein AVEN_125101-1 [Araneus ventricosus]
MTRFTSGIKSTDTNRCVCKERIACKKPNIFKTGRHESVCVQGTHRLQKAEHFQNRSTRIGVCAMNASSAEVNRFQTSLQKSVCVQVALVLRFRLRGRRAPGSKSDFTEDPPYMRACCTLNHT